MILLKRELFANLNGTLEGLKAALQNAIELEHSTIPPYLYALYSLRPNTNLEIAGLIKSVVVEEMLHMAIDCNILNAIGGTPQMDDPCFIPKYPGHLPGGVEGSLIVGLTPFSKQVLKDTFMAIEEPEEPLRFPVLTAAEVGDQQTTIGQFYSGIMEQIRKLGDGIFLGDPKKQLTTGFAALQQLHIHDVQTADEGIRLIVGQGEGARRSPYDREHELAHYYRFAEIYFGKKMIPNPNPGPNKPRYVYGGHVIEFDPAGVLPAMANPNRTSYDPGSAAFRLNEAFNQTYSSLLKMLQLTFSGEPDRLGPAITLMEAMKSQAQVLMTTEVVPGQTAGPTFDYVPSH
jgi:hypothetical protein